MISLSVAEAAGISTGTQLKHNPAWPRARTRLLQCPPWAWPHSLSLSSYRHLRSGPSPPTGGASSSFPDAAAWGRRALRKKLDLRAELDPLGPWEQSPSYSSPSPHEAVQGKPQEMPGISVGRRVLSAHLHFPRVQPQHTTTWQQLPRAL